MLSEGHWLSQGLGPVWCCNALSPGQVELEGLTGHIEFNSKGQRSNYALKILQFTRNGFRQVSLAPVPPWQTPSLFLSLSPVCFSLALRMASCSPLSPRTTGCPSGQAPGCTAPCCLSPGSASGTQDAATARYQGGIALCCGVKGVGGQGGGRGPWKEAMPELSLRLGSFSSLDPALTLEPC